MMQKPLPRNARHQTPLRLISISHAITRWGLTTMIVTLLLSKVPEAFSQEAMTGTVLPPPMSIW